MVSGFLSASTRRGLMIVMVAALLCGASVSQAQAQAPAPAAPPAQAPAAAPPAAPDTLKITGDSAVLIWQVKPAGAADFESAWGAIKTALMASDKPDMKELGTSFTMYKVAVPGAPAGPAVYVFTVSSPSKTLSYDPVKILYNAGSLWEGKRPEADVLFKKISDAIDGITSLPLMKVGA
jgi:hypothetical protein